MALKLKTDVVDVDDIDVALGTAVKMCQLDFFIVVFSCVHKTLYVTLLVRPAVRPAVCQSVRHKVQKHF